MKQTISIFLIFVFILQLFSKVWIFIDFKINQNYIVNNLCVKKEIKNNDCKGHCQLCKRLDKADKDEQKQIPQTLKEKQEILYCFQPNGFCLKRPFFFNQKSSLNSQYCRAFSASHISDIFRPPQFFV